MDRGSLSFSFQPRVFSVQIEGRIAYVLNWLVIYLVWIIFTDLFLSFDTIMSKHNYFHVSKIRIEILTQKFCMIISEIEFLRQGNAFWYIFMLY